MNGTDVPCPDFDYFGPHINCQAPCSQNTILLKAFYVSVPTDFGVWNIKVALSFLWSLVPTLLVIAYFLAFAFRGDMIHLVAGVYIMCLSVINSMFATLIGMGGSKYSDRPEGSCNESKGLPSGHSCNAIGTFTYMVLEIWFGCGKDHAMNFDK
jgi:hypothetical protein